MRRTKKESLKQNKYMAGRNVRLFLVDLFLELLYNNIVNKMLEVYIMKYISCKQYESALFNMDSLRTKLLNERDDAFMSGDEQKYETICSRVEEVETLLGKMYMNNIRKKDWERIQQLVNERKMQRYITCLNSGMDERIAAGAFED